MQQVDSKRTIFFFKKLLSKNCDQKTLEWIDSKQKAISTIFDHKQFYMAFSQAPRFVSKELLKPETIDAAALQLLRKGMDISTWTCDQAARVYFLISIPTNDKDVYVNTINTLFDSADVGELKSLYASFPLLSYPKSFEFRQAEGVRSNITDVVEIVAFNNPYTLEYLNDDSWNQLVIKVIFIDKNINQIYGLDQRRNFKLSRIARDLAHERWAAGRAIRPELWRLVLPFVDDEIVEDIKTLLKSDKEYERLAGVLICKESGSAKTFGLYDKQQYSEEIINSITWQSLAEKYKFSGWS